MEQKNDSIFDILPTSIIVIILKYYYEKEIDEYPDILSRPVKISPLIRDVMSLSSPTYNSLFPSILQLTNHSSQNICKLYEKFGLGCSLEQFFAIRDRGLMAYAMCGLLASGRIEIVKIINDEKKYKIIEDPKFVQIFCNMYVALINNDSVAEYISGKINISNETYNCAFVSSVISATDKKNISAMKYLSEKKNVKLIRNVDLAKSALEHNYFPALKFIHELWHIEKKDIYQYLSYIYSHGNIDMIKYAFDTWKLTYSDIVSSYPNAIMYASMAGHVSVLEYFRNYGMTVDDIRGENNAAFCIACAEGRLNVIQYFHDVWHLTVDDVRSRHNAIHGSSKKGRITLLRYLFDTWHLTADDARANNCQALIGASANGHLSIVTYLIRDCGLDIKDIRNCGYEPFYRACSGGHVDVLRYFGDIFEVDEKLDVGKAIYEASSQGHVSVLEYINSRYDNIDLTTAVRSYDNKALLLASEGGHVSVLYFLNDVWHLTAEDVKKNFNGSLCAASKNGHVMVLQFFRDVWRLSSADMRSLNNYPLALAIEYKKISVIKHFHESWHLDENDIVSAISYVKQEMPGSKKIIDYVYKLWNFKCD